MNVTFIGLGIMGRRMARNLLVQENLTLTVYNRSPEPAKLLEREGASAAETAAVAVRDADVVFTMLSSPEVVDAVAFGKEGFVPAMREGALWVNCSTVNPSFTRKAAERVRQRGLRFIDAPVAGTKMPAEEGKLTFLVGGDEGEVARIEPLLQRMGSKILHVGSTGQGSAFKMLVNAMLAQAMVAYSETALLGEKLGFSRDFLMEILPELPVSAPFLNAKAELIRSQAYEAQFPLELMYKDLHLLELTAYEQGQPLYLANLAKELYASASAAGHGRKDFAAIHDFLDKG